MKALILKDFYVLWKQLKLFLLIVVVMSAIPSSFNNVFAVIYAAMMPYSVMAYDERSKWNQLAAMMPYSTRDLVLSKYVFGWMCVTAAAVLSLVIQGLFHLLGVFPSRGVSYAMPFLALCSAVCILAVILPLLFRFSVEKARALMFFVVFLVCGSAGAVGSIVIADGDGGISLGGPTLAAMPLLAVVLSAVSVFLSIHLYPRREH